MANYQPMTPFEVQQARAKQMAKIQKAMRKVKLAQAEIKMIQDCCTHPAKYNYTAQGDPGQRCPDCGWDI